MDEIYEFFKNFFPASILLTFPLVFVFVPIQYASAANEFPIYRMQQYNFYGVTHGCKGSSFSLEAKSIKTWKTYRHCVITRLKDLSTSSYLDIAEQAGALLIMLPKDIELLTDEEKLSMVEVERAILTHEVTIPVYFAAWDKTLQGIINNIDILSIPNNDKTEKKETAVEALFNSIFAMGYQAYVNAAKPSPMSAVIPVIQGKLPAYGMQSSMSPTILIVAHYDALSIIPEMSFGADSNGSGVTILLELARLFSKLYSKTKTQPRYNLVFLLPGGGKFSYLGSKKWIEEQSDGTDPSDDAAVNLQNVAFVLCLDSLASTNQIFAHVSKPPKNGTLVSKFLQELKNVANQENGNFSTIHKKINLAEQMLAWEHERFSMKRLPAFTLSSLQNPKDWKRTTIFDRTQSVKVNNLYSNTKIIAESLARLLFNFSDSNILVTYKVEIDSLDYGLSFISSHTRSAIVLSDKDNSLVSSLYHIMNRYLQCNVTHMYADKNNPEFIFFNVLQSTVNIYSVKPAIFDLVLTCIIGAYLTVVYYAIQKFPLLYSSIAATVQDKKKMNK